MESLKLLGVQLGDHDRYVKDNLGNYSPLIEDIDLSLIGFNGIISFEKQNNKKNTNPQKVYLIVRHNPWFILLKRIISKIGFKSISSRLLVRHYQRLINQY